MLVLMTGATGLLGKEIGKKLIEEGHAIVVLARNATGAREELPFPAKIFEWKNFKDEVPIGAMEGVEAVIHLAGEPVAGGRWTEKRKKLIYDSRAVGTTRVAEAALRSGVKHFISASAIGIYGNRGDEELFENSSEGSDFLADVCEAWEGATGPLALQGVRVVNLRIGIVLSRHGGALEKLLPLFSLGLGGALGDGSQYMSWIHLDDVVGLFVFALHHPKIVGPLNAVAPRPVKNREFSIALAKSLGKNLFLPAPKFAIKAVLGEMSKVVLGGQKVSAKKAMLSGFDYRFTELGSALREICAPLQGNQKEMFSEQWVPKAPAEIFPFFSDEKNLGELTPKFLGFRVLKKSTPSIQKGTLIDYRLSLYGIPLGWRTRIEEWAPPSRFVDNQLKGPYKKWHHTHEFIPFAGGTLMRDRVHYQVPMGWLGAVGSGAKVRNDVSAIFSYRRKIIQRLFGAA